MTDANTTASEVTPSAGTLEDRVASVTAALDGETSQSAGDVNGASAPPAEAAPPSPADSDAAKRAAERRARLEALKATTREAADRKEQQKAIERMRSEHAAALARAEAAERAAQERIDRSLLKDPAKLIRMMGAEGIAPDAVANAIREAIQDPTIGASHAAREAVSPELAAMRQQLEQTQAALMQMQQHYEAQQAAQYERQATESFLGMVAQASDRAPLAAQLLAHDRDEFLEIATIAASKVPGLGPDALLDAVEDLLDSDVRKVAQKYAAIYGTPPSQAPAPVPSARAAAKAIPTVSNSVAQERASLVEEESFASLPIEERAARLIRSM